MNTHRLFASLLLLLMSCCSFAGWQVSNPQLTIPREPFFQAGTQRRMPIVPMTASVKSTIFPNRFAVLGPAAPVYAVSISGSLKENLERILGRYHWRVIWKAPFDYNFDGKVAGPSLPNVVGKILNPFPLQAVMYMSNRTVLILPRERT